MSEEKTMLKDSGRGGPSIWVLALGLAIACSDTDQSGSMRGTSTDAAVVPDGGAADGSVVAPDAGPPEALMHVDLLLVVDPSNSITGANAVLQDYLQDLTTRLATRAAEIHAGVITMDLGDFGFRTPGCSAMGDDAVLRQTGDVAIAGCAMDYPPFLRLEPANLTAAEQPGAIETLATDLACMVPRGYEQPLEATLKALTPTEGQRWTAPRFQPRTFASGVGHASNPDTNGVLNDGRPFLHDDAVLAIVVLTNEDDCSAADQGLFNPQSSQYLTATSLRCTQHPAALHPVNRYVEALLELRRQPSQLVIQVIAGLPEERSLVDSVEGLQGVLDDPQMTLQLDDDMRVVPACSRANGAQALPARRLVELAQQLAERGARSSAASICAAGLDAASATLAQQVIEALRPDGT